MIKDQQMNYTASDTEQRPINQPSLKSGEGCCFFVVVVCFSENILQIPFTYNNDKSLKSSHSQSALLDDFKNGKY